MEKVTFDVLGGRGPERKLFIDAATWFGGGGIGQQLDRARSVKGYSMEAQEEFTASSALRRQRRRRSNQDPARRRVVKLLLSEEEYAVLCRPQAGSGWPSAPTPRRRWDCRLDGLLSLLGLGGG
ncbi:MAG: hypothetical protein JWN52_325 [Actinomycetia bacterium]|jgi:hypothetical protein|nr:hypothetical protein [Actinomycetes bacterium]